MGIQREASRKRGSDARAVRAYEAPKLRVFGAVGVLTQGGTGSRAEAGGRGNMMNMNLMRRV